MTRARLAAGLGAGLCLALAMPPHGHAALGLGTFALLALASRGATPRDAALAWWVGGFTAFAATGPWFVATVSRFTGAPVAASVALFALACGWMALAWALAGYAAARTSLRLGAPLAMALSAWAALRFGPRVFPYPLALPLVQLPALPQCADLVGVEGLGAALLALARMEVDALARRSLGASLVPLVALAGMAVYGSVREAQTTRALAAAPTLTVALVQPAVGAALRWEPWAREAVLARLRRMTYEGAQGAALTVWHEGAFPYDVTWEARRDGDGAPEAITDFATPLLFGAMARPRDPQDLRRFNAVLLRAGDGAITAAAAKRTLLPFGEYVPVAVWLPSLHAALTDAGGVTPGPRPQRMSLGRNEIGVLNCFEDTVPEAAAELAGVDLLVNVTNDAWFDAANNAQHVLAARWRSIELRRDLVRASNEGASGHIDARGREMLRAPQGVAGVWRASPRLLRALSTTAPWAMVWGPRMALAVVAAAWWHARRREGER